MTREQWFSNRENPIALLKTLKSPEVSLAIEVILDANKRRIQSLSASPERNLNTDAAQFNEQAGFNRFLCELQDLSTPRENKSDDLAATYGAASELDRISEDPEELRKAMAQYIAANQKKSL